MGIKVFKTRTFNEWFMALRDIRAKKRIQARIDRMEEGNPGDVKSLGEGVWEMRVDYGPGYRIYFMKRGSEFVLLLAGGDKRTQARDIQNAQKMVQESNL
jgi:putative addiction module killer protein